uniref:uncharacterized protein isoform X2 n=1 Tax=Myxine glutinosa TaxID=7769 RepID=UPI00358E3C9F
MYLNTQGLLLLVLSLFPAYSLGQPVLPECSDGFHWEPSIQQCQDVDECSSIADACQSPMICVNHHGGYMCVSPSARVITFGGDDKSSWEAQIDDEDDTHVPEPGPQYSRMHTPLEPPDPHGLDDPLGNYESHGSHAFHPPDSAPVVPPDPHEVPDASYPRQHSLHDLRSALGSHSVAVDRHSLPESQHVPLDSQSERVPVNAPFDLHVARGHQHVPLDPHTHTSHGHQHVPIAPHTARGAQHMPMEPHRAQSHQHVPLDPRAAHGHQPLPFDPHAAHGHQPLPFDPHSARGHQPLPVDPHAARGHQPIPVDPHAARGHQPIPVDPHAARGHQPIPVDPHAARGHQPLPVDPHAARGHQPIPVDPHAARGHQPLPVDPHAARGHQPLPVDPHAARGHQSLPVDPHAARGHQPLPVDPHSESGHQHGPPHPPHSESGHQHASHDKHSALGFHHVAVDPHSIPESQHVPLDSHSARVPQHVPLDPHASRGHQPIPIDPHLESGSQHGPPDPPHTERGFQIHRHRLPVTMSCPTGYLLEEDYCVDVDECAEEHSPCREPLVCTNVPGTFHCQCPKGYLTTAPHGTCQDVDECQLRPCQQVCVNTPGSFQCQCHRGFTLTADGRGCEDTTDTADVGTPESHDCVNGAACEGVRHCERRCSHRRDVDECQAAVSPCRYNCHNTPGSFYCSCPHGFTLHRNARDCVDVNECDSASHDCGPSSDCMNMPGGYRCIEKMRCQSPYTRVSHDTCACTAGHSACLRRPHSISRRFIFMSTNRRAPANLFHVRATRIQHGAHASFRLRSDSPGVPMHFILTRTGAYSAVLRLVQPISTAQDMQMELELETWHPRRSARASVLLRLFVFVLQMPF